MNKLLEPLRWLLSRGFAGGVTVRAANAAKHAFGYHHGADLSTVEKNALAAGLLTVAIFLGSGMALSIKTLSDYPAIQLVFTRSALVVGALLPILLWKGVRFWRVRQPGLLILRGLLASSGQVFTVLAVFELPLADVQALSFSRAFMVVGLGVILLGEVVTWRRWTAVALGFLGVLIVANPTATLNVAVLYALAGTLSFAGSLVVAKMLLASESRGTLMIWNASVQFCVSIVPAMLLWKQPTGWDPLIFVAMAALVLVVQPISLQAFRLGEISALAPVDYLRILTGAVVGFVFFAEVPGSSLWFGAALIIAANIWIQRENRRAEVNHPVVEPSSVTGTSRFKPRA